MNIERQLRVGIKSGLDRPRPKKGDTLLPLWERAWYNYYITLKRKRKEKMNGEK